MRKFVNWVLPKEYLETLPISLQKQLPIILYGDLFLAIYFITGAVIRLLESPKDYYLFFISVLISSLSFLVSIALLKKKRPNVAAYLASIGLWFNPTWVGLCLPAEGIISIYRMISYTLTATIVNLMMSVSKRQLLIYVAANTLSFLGVSLIYIIPSAGGFTKEITSAFFYCCSP